MLKKYADQMDEISDDELYEGLMIHGLFSDKLPPFLSSESFFNYCKVAKQLSNKSTSYIYFESIKHSNEPRLFGIPNPFLHEKLCKCLSQHWSEIRQHFHDKTDGQDHVISRIHIRKIKDTRCLFKMNYPNWKTEGNPDTDFLVQSKYLVEADISKCFPSIYSHALTWALAGKDIAKSNQKNDSLWYNKIDKATYSSKNLETHGILIGPHTSNLLSEIILTSIDKKLYDKGWKYIRNIDDYKCYVESYELAQKFLLDLSEELREFDLLLNHKKTKILELPNVETQEWKWKINSLPVLNSKF